MSLLDDVVGYLNAGLCVLPAIRLDKRPALPNWKQYQGRLPTERQVRAWFTGDRENTKENACCLLTGAISGNLELIDFDCDGELFERWRELVTSEAPGLCERLVIERSQSGSRHVIYRYESPVPGNRKLAQRVVELESAEPVTIGGKQYVPRQVKDHFEVTLTLIETRGEGGLFLCAPTPGYVLEQGALDGLPVLTEGERAILIAAALALNEVTPPAQPTACPGIVTDRPGDGFNERGDIREILRKHGWRQVRGGDNEHWRRPGKTNGWSATLKNGVFHVFSTNAAPFEAERSYAPFSVFALLEHGGDFKQAALTLREDGFGETQDEDVDLGGILASVPADVPEPSEPTIQYVDPGPLPLEMCRVPGFIAEVMDHTLANAPYPNVPLAFCGALALQAVLAGRKVRDAGDNRTNLYILALAYPSVGKDWPRKVNAHILHQVGLVNALGEKFASGEGIQDSLHRTPSMLFQTDEIDGLLQSINKSQDARYENILGTLLTMYSSANSIYPMRRKAGNEPPGVIDQPCLVVYGTAVPPHYYAALSERMLTNGFFARMLIIESGARSAGQEPGVIDPPSHVMEIARWWSEFCPGTGNLEHFHPRPGIVPASDEARAMLIAARQASEAEYSAAEARSDAVGTTVWGRVPEQIRKLALLYAVSANHESPRIDSAAVRWANDFILHQTRRMLFMANNHVAENPFHAQCLKLLRKLREAEGTQMQRQHLMRAMHCKAIDFDQLIATLIQQGDIVPISMPTKTKTAQGYSLA